jgi:5-methylcytosine-specific restriction endonuclease McrA
MGRKHQSKRKIPKTIKQTILKRNNFKCYFCGSTDNIQLHHIIPKRLGGTSDPENLIPLCDNCHKKLHNLIDPVIDYLIHKQY